MKRAGFTLIELLIVIGILGILVVTVILSLNPQEAQRKTRDAKRMKDMTSLQGALDQYVQDNPPPASAVNVTSDMAGGSTSCTTSGWTGLDLCTYLRALPVDPTNDSDRQVAGAAGSTACPATTASQATNYRIFISTGGEYEINVRQESTANCGNLTNDGGNSNYWSELGTNLTLLGD